MRKSVVHVMSAAVLLAAGVANAQDEGFYISGFGGAAFFDDISIGTPVFTFGADPDTGFGVGGAMGYGLANGLRFEGEVAYRQVGFDQIATGGGLVQNGDFSTDSLSVMANVWYDLPVDLGRFQPYVGAGIGIADTTLALDQGATLALSDRVFAYQAGAGTSIEIADGVETFVQYRYYGTQDSEGAVLGLPVDWNTGSHNVEGGVRLWIN